MVSLEWPPEKKNTKGLRANLALCIEAELWSYYSEASKINVTPVLGQK